MRAEPSHFPSGTIKKKSEGSFASESRARILLSSVFGPYAQDDSFGSRTINPMELYHNQVTRTQGPFSLRMFHRSWGLMLIQANIDAPCTLLDFPSLERFEQELRAHPYNVVGISSITTNILKVKRMCELVRAHLPAAAIVVGGHVANIPDLADRIDADWIVRGDGVDWFRRFLGEETKRPIRHPIIPTRIGTRNMGISVTESASEVAATLIPSVGCPVGCNFCATSAMFGGKGKTLDFYSSGDELFDVMCQIEEVFKNRSFFVMDENFLMRRERSLRLLELMGRYDKSWILYVFSSAQVVQSYSMEQLVGLGVSWIWMGIEGKSSRYDKVNRVDTFGLVRRLQSHGIRVLGSTILGLDEHTPQNIDQAIEYAVQHDCDFHQFMLYTPLPGTPLYDDFGQKGRLLDESECALPDTHGQFRFNHRHPHLPAGVESDLVVKAFQRDFAVNGPSMVRMLRTVLAGWKRYKGHPNHRIRARFACEVEGMSTTFSAVVGAAKRYFKNDPDMRAKMAELLIEMKREFGWIARLSSWIGGPYVLWKIRQEERRLAAGWTYEPPTFYEVNEAAALTNREATPCRFVTPQFFGPSPHDGGKADKRPAAFPNLGDESLSVNHPAKDNASLMEP